MSRLDSFIRRMSAQRDCLNHAAELIRDLPGSVLELGLGNGRTFDHLRSLMPDRDIYVFDRHVQAHPDCIPDQDHMIVGDFLETIPNAAERMASKAVLAHCDIGSGDKAASVALAKALGDSLPRLLAPGAIIVSDQPFEVAKWQSRPLPEGVAEGRYHIYQQM
ncbi:hypothetical protein GQF03_15800 [Sneathiella chungangensis]|uniref:S-adenosyl-L-methionine methyltransferase n=1 Tax=Sneathiella chungangensis TaxID=1418234 RepID=A0A845MJ83_9PROT|nr:class I SAM-dependent methyltransferase [Sneathiella chungangensis]MZR23801.1 hypothetical protein [Sneathiella chungangensis]